MFDLFLYVLVMFIDLSMLFLVGTFLGVHLIWSYDLILDLVLCNRIDHLSLFKRVSTNEFTVLQWRLWVFEFQTQTVAPNKMGLDSGVGWDIRAYVNLLNFRKKNAYVLAQFMNMYIDDGL